MLVLSSHVARLLSSYFLAIRRLEEAELVLEKTPGSGDILSKVSSELLELYFLRLRLRLDPERDAPAYAEADELKRRSAATRQRFAGADMKVRDADIDFELGRSYVNLGQIDTCRAAVPQRARPGRTDRRGDDRARQPGAQARRPAPRDADPARGDGRAARQERIARHHRLYNSCSTRLGTTKYRNIGIRFW